MISRLSESQKFAVDIAAHRHVQDPTLVRVGESWGVVGRDADNPDTWTGLLVRDVEPDGSVWWTAHTYGLRRRSDVVESLQHEASR